MSSLYRPFILNLLMLLLRTHSLLYSTETISGEIDHSHCVYHLSFSLVVAQGHIAQHLPVEASRLELLPNIWHRQQAECALHHRYHGPCYMSYIVRHV